MIDSHAHLTSQEVSSNLGAVLKDFVVAGGKGILNVGHSPESNLEILQLSRQKDGITSPKIDTAIGLHPEIFSPTSSYAKPFTTYDSARKALSEYAKLLERNLGIVDAIGECGLDYYRLFESKELSMTQKEEVREIQIMAFRKHVELSLKHKLPLTIHIREEKGSSRCIEDALQIVSEVGKGSAKGSFHSYTGDQENLQHILDLGFYVGFNGIITYKSADNVRELCKLVPMDRILLETDTPYLPPTQVRDDKARSYKMGQPSDLQYIAKKLAKIKEVPLEQLLEETTNNYEEMLNS